MESPGWLQKRLLQKNYPAYTSKQNIISHIILYEVFTTDERLAQYGQKIVKNKLKPRPLHLFVFIVNEIYIPHIFPPQQYFFCNHPLRKIVTEKNNFIE